MKERVSRAIAKNVVIAATMALAVITSWAVTGVRAPVIEMGTVNACASGATAAADKGECKTTGSRQG